MNNEIETLKAELLKIGPFHPGKVSEQFIKCGKKNCKCADPNMPQKHGPYYQLSYSIGKKHSTVFLKPEELKEAQSWIAEYEKFRETVQSLTQAYVLLAKKHRWKG